jgi:hypothetical protein
LNAPDADTQPRRAGRAKLWHENINLTLPKGAKAQMDAALEEGEDRLDLIRGAIAKELRRRSKRKGGKPAAASA